MAANPALLRDQQTLKYLQALNKIFERGILSSQKVTATDRKLLDIIREGFSYFEEWYAEVVKQGVDPGDQKQKAFLAWQVSI